MTIPKASDALKDIRVIDLSRVRSGPTAARQFADWGADVIKVEPPESVEPDGALGAGRDTADFQNLQRNKRSITLNLKTEGGINVLRELIKTADVVIENFRPDVKNRLGLDYESLRDINPRIILGSISGFGQDGPYAKRPGFDQIAQGMGGLMSITGEPGGGPMRVGIPIADLCAGLFCAMGVLTALYERERSGEGQWVQTSLLQSQIFMLDFQAARWLTQGDIPKQAGNDHPTSIPTGVFPTTDGTINIACAGEAIWQRCAIALGHPEWIEDPRFATNEDRSGNRKIMNELIAQITQTNSSHYWVDLLLEKGVPAGPIYTMDEVFDDPQVRHLGIAADANTLPFGKTKLVGQPFTMNRTPSHIATHPPARGEHTEEILNELGINDFNQLRANNII
ncbi:CoA transferase [Litorivicinus sp.]|nr:CoA transferase [Litorivicinus sp.]MDB9862179.1 CoA transferase [Litorivicinus sp.]MDC1239796.1 CoA transferase [Litorivicinus sp.]MDC1466541.1 CoA transferase [Litorivicinus sp.]